MVTFFPATVAAMVTFSGKIAVEKPAVGRLQRKNIPKVLIYIDLYKKNYRSTNKIYRSTNKIYRFIKINTQKFIIIHRSIRFKNTSKLERKKKKTPLVAAAEGASLGGISTVARFGEWSGFVVVVGFCAGVFRWW